MLHRKEKQLKKRKKNLIEAVTLYIESAVENNLSLIIRPVPEDAFDENMVIELFALKIDFSVKAYV